MCVTFHATQRTAYIKKKYCALNLNYIKFDELRSFYVHSFHHYLKKALGKCYQTNVFNFNGLVYVEILSKQYQSVFFYISVHCPAKKILQAPQLSIIFVHLTFIDKTLEKMFVKKLSILKEENLYVSSGGLKPKNLDDI